MKASKKIAVGAVLASLGVVIMFLGALFGVLDISAACIASFIVLFCAVELGNAYALTVYAVICALSFIICSNDFFAPFCFAFMFGPMAATRYIFEKAGKAAGTVLKLLLPNLLMLPAGYFFRALLEIPDKTWVYIVYIIAVNVLSVMTQILYKMTVRIYFFKWRQKIEKLLK